MDKKSIFKESKEIYRKRLEFDLLKIDSNHTKCVEIAKSQIGLASQLHLSEIAYSYATYLKYYYSSIKSRGTPFKKYSILTEKFSRQLIMEVKVKSKYSDFLAHFNLKGKLKPELDMILFFEDCLQEKGLTYQSALRCYQAIASYYQNKGQNDEVMKVSEAALAYFDSLHFETKRIKENFTIVLAPLYIINSKYGDAEKIINSAMPRKKTENYFKLSQYKIINYLHSGQISKCSSFVFNSPVIKMSDKIKANWEVYKGFCSMLSVFKMTEQEYSFNFNKLVKKLDFVKSDKKGSFYNVIIIDFMMLYLNDKMRLIDRAEAFKKYAMRHSNPGSRFRILMNGLVKWVNNSFKADLEPLKQKLSNMDKYPVYLEIYPYERLIEILQSHEGKG